MIGREGLEGGWRTPLHAATDWPGYFPAAPAAVAMLVEVGADPNDDTGGARPETPLHWAASTDDVDVAVVLMDNGADLETPGGSIGTPLDDAIGYGCWHVARLLVARGARVDKLWHAAALGMLERIEQLVGDRAEAAGEVSQAFWHACAGSQRRAAEYLLGQGAELNWTPDYADGTPLDSKALWAPARRTSSAGCGSEVPPQRSPVTEGQTQLEPAWDERPIARPRSQ